MKQIGKTTSAASRHATEPRSSSWVSRAPTGSQTAVYNNVRVRLANIGCTSGRHFDAAHDNGTSYYEPFHRFLRRPSIVIVPAHDGVDLADDGPIRRNPHFYPSP